MRLFILLFFFLSGAAGLIYEVVWTKLLTLVIGSTTYSLSTVLVAFMGGLALGSYVGGRIIDRKGNPLLLYGVLEGLIGLYCLAVPSLIDLTEPLFAFFYNRCYTDQFYLFSLARFFISALILIVPTTLMGATLPVLSKFFARHKDKFGWDVGRLYAVNTLGAMAGSFGSGFVMLPALGKWLTIVSAAAGNLLICLLVVAYWLFRGRRLTPPAESGEGGADEERGTEQPVETARGPTIGRAAVWAVLIAYAANGFSGMAYQIAWTRALSLSLGSSTYSFSLILTVFIFGLAAGAAAGARLVDRLKNPVMAFGWVEVLIGFSATGVMYGLGNLPLWIAPIFARYQTSYETLLSYQFAIVFALLLLPTFLMGMAFPLAVKVVGMGKAGVGRPVGLAYGWNTAGAILGSFVGGFALIPLVGIQDTIGSANMVNWLAGAALLGIGGTIAAKGSLWKWRAAAAATALAGAAVLIAMPAWDAHITDSGPFMYAEMYMKHSSERKITLRQLLGGHNIVFHKEGVDVNVSVVSSKARAYKLIRINGKTDASTGDDMITQALLAHIPMLLYEGVPDDVLVIGLASGVTAGAVTRYPVKAVDVVEISKTVVEASRYFNDYNYNVLSDPRVRLIVGDGRNHLKLTDRRYDVIISEPTNPWIAGVSNLFTLQYFQSAREHLNRSGMFCVWLQAYLLKPEEFKMVIRTFQRVFPHVTMWESVPSADYLLVGSMSAPRFDLKSILSKMADERVKKDLGRVGIKGLPNLMSRYLATSRELETLTEGKELHTDDRLQLEYQTPKSLHETTYPALYKEILRFAAFPALGMDWNELGAGFKDELSKMVESRRLVHKALQRKTLGQYEEAREMFGRAFELNPDDLRIRHELGDLLKDMGMVYTEAGNYERALQVYEQAGDIDDKSSIIDDRVGAVYLAMGENEDARKAFERAYGKSDRDVMAQFNLGYIALKGDDLPVAIKWFEGALEIMPDYPYALNGMGLAAGIQQRMEEAARYFERAIKANPEFVEAYINLANVLTQNRDRKKEAIGYLLKALEIDPDSADANSMMGFVLLKEGERKAEGIEYLKKALRLNPNHPNRRMIEEALEREGEKP